MKSFQTKKCDYELLGYLPCQNDRTAFRFYGLLVVLLKLITSLHDFPWITTCNSIYLFSTEAEEHSRLGGCQAKMTSRANLYL